MIDAAGNRRKLIIFTEPKDTLHYLLEKVRARLGNPEAVDVIHGGVYSRGAPQGRRAVHAGQRPAGADR